MDHTTNLPTLLATSAAPLFYAAAAHLAGRPLPPGFGASTGPHGELVLARASARLSLPAELVASLLEAYGTRKAPGVLRLAPKVLAAALAMARADFLAGRLRDGHFALCLKYDKQGGGSKGLSRLCAHLGKRGDDPAAQRRALAAFRLLEGCTLVIEPKGPGAPMVFQGLVSVCEGTRRFKGIEERGRRHRGGEYRVGRVHPELLALSLRRFLPMPARACELGAVDFAVWLAAAGQAAARGGARASLLIDRLVREAGLSEEGRAGDAREVRRLRASLGRLEAAGLLELEEAGEGRLALVVPHLAPPPPQPGGAKPQSPAAKPQSPATKPQSPAAGRPQTTKSGGQTTKSGGQTTKSGGGRRGKRKKSKKLRVR